MTALTNVSPLRLFRRLSALSLHNMCSRPILDAEAHGKDGNNRPEQLYFSTGDVSHCFFSFLSHFICVQAHFVAPAFCPESDFYCSGSGAGQRFVCTILHLISAAAVCDFL